MISKKITYSVIVRDPNSWCESTGIHQELAHCGHKHRTTEAAQDCMDKLTAWHCFCGRTTQSYAPCCHTPHNSTSARWYHAQIEASNGSANTGAGDRAIALKLEYPDLSPGQIAKAVGCNPSNVHRVLARFEAVIHGQ
jgi:hypothetical protein